MSDTSQEQPKKVRSIYLFKMLNGVKTRWKFDVDSDMVILEEGPSPLPTQNEVIKISGDQAQAAIKQTAIDRYKKTLDERGIKYTVTDEGQIVVTSVPNQERQILQFFDLKQPCPDVEGMAAIRSAYEAEYIKAGGDACPGCQLNSIQRKYRSILEVKVFNNA